ncbi:hypothetical protein HETIRDRAFT_448490 [Heterobasidion irregulare TC 32-1]|uniref:Uncharacterized protein n=1 Tax=Heterobasidion irregulare (strain TC 32-1) TaxID=747525 RepID=W4KHP4_HETIT|nr:uncharacterized protein HETIRDRAFT_448490 [Heterobasidion irregulare TC 32-1]ETW85373.1 hypothetical protein HETIRDRAFT_448490 [Heterobasidion irregulare TC 32-1]
MATDTDARRPPHADRRTLGARNAAPPRDTHRLAPPQRAHPHTRSRTDTLAHPYSPILDRLHLIAACARGRQSVEGPGAHARRRVRPSTCIICIFISRAAVLPLLASSPCACGRCIYPPRSPCSIPPHTRSVSHLVPSHLISSHRTGSRLLCSHLGSSRLGSSFPLVFYFVLHPRTPPSTMSNSPVLLLIVPALIIAPNLPLSLSVVGAVALRTASHRAQTRFALQYAATTGAALPSPLFFIGFCFFFFFFFFFFCFFLVFSTPKITHAPTRRL